MLRFLRIGLTLVAMAVTAVLALVVTLRVIVHASEVPIPNLAGLTVAEASDAALRDGLDLNIANKLYSTTVPAGRILSQAPAPGSQVRKGWQVRVNESLGPQQVTIPDVVGEPIREATMDLRRNQLDLGAQAHFDAPGQPDFVLAQTPPPNGGIDQPRIDLLLSSQAEDASTAFVMPSFVNLNYSTAYRQAIALGLRVATVGGIVTPAPVTPSPDASAPSAAPVPGSSAPDQIAAAPVVPATPAGPVLSQSPESGHRASRGSTVRLYFSRASTPAPSAGTTVTVPTTPSPTP